MANKVTFDTVNKLIIVNFGVTELDIRVDLLSDAKEDWQSDALDTGGVRLNKFQFLFRAIGGDATAPGEIAPLYLYLRYGWRIRPQELNHILNIVGGAILVDGETTLDPFANTVEAFNVRIRMYVPIQASLVESDGAGLSTDEHNKLMTGLDVSIPDNVWDEAYADHKLAGTFGKLMDIIRKANLSVDGTITANNTAVSFDTDLDEPTGTHDCQLLIMTSGALTGYTKPIKTFINGVDNIIVLQGAFPLAPAIGDEFTILPDHVHDMDKIADRVLDRSA